MNVSGVYELLDEFYGVKHGLNADQLCSGTCPRCEKEDSDLRLFVKAEEEFQEIVDSGDIEEPEKFFFGSCHHCGMAIHFFHFAKYHSGLTQEEAHDIIAEDSGFTVTREERVEVDEKPFPPLIELSGDVIHDVYARGITDEMIARYGILYSIGNFEYDGRQIYYSHRIFFPIYSRKGEICGFQGRAIAESGAKYLTAPWMNKSEVLYGCHEYPTGVGHLLLVEGVMDKLGWHKVGLNAVASFGKSISDAQIEILLDINPDVLYLAYDRDALSKSFDFCERNLHRFKKILIISMPFGRDSDEMTDDELVDCIENAVEYDCNTKLLMMMEDL